MLQNGIITRIVNVGLIKVAIYALLILITYYTTLDWLVFRDWTREEYSHGIIIPFFVLYLLWSNRNKIATASSYPTYSGLAVLFIGIMLFWIGELGGELFSMYLSLWFVIIGLVYTHFGWKKFKAMAFPLFFLLTTFPIPALINNKINFQLRLLSSNIGIKILHLFGVPAYREGNIIELSFTKLQVVDACSGLKYTLSLMILSLVLAYLSKRNLWKRIIIFLSAFPLAILFNSLRIAVTAIIFKFYGQEAAEGFFHGFTGWIVFGLAFLFLLFIMMILNKIPTANQKIDKKSSLLSSESDKEEKQGKNSDKDILLPNEIEKQSKTEDNGSNEGKFSHKIGNRRSILSPLFLSSIIILLLNFTLSHAVDFRKKIPIIKSLSNYPLSVNKWDGQRSEIEASIIDSLDLSDYTLINYKDPTGKVINFYVSYYESQSKGKSTHSPETCLPGSGWVFKTAGVIKLTLDDGNGFIPVNRAYIENSGEKQLVYFWFPMRGRILTNLFQVKIYNFFDALTKQRTDGALVRVMTPIYEDEKADEADNRLSNFVRIMEPLLTQYLPK